jgi:hypothetical protein
MKRIVLIDDLVEDGVERPRLNISWRALVARIRRSYSSLVLVARIRRYKDVRMSQSSGKSRTLTIARK